MAERTRSCDRHRSSPVRISACGDRTMSPGGGPPTFFHTAATAVRETLIKLVENLPPVLISTSLFSRVILTPSKTQAGQPQTCLRGPAPASNLRRVITPTTLPWQRMGKLFSHMPLLHKIRAPRRQLTFYCGGYSPDFDWTR